MKIGYNRNRGNLPEREIQMKNINEDIKRNRLKQIYLLYGEESYLRRQYREKLKAALCWKDDTMNTHYFEGKNISVGEVIDLAETLPFLAERRVIFIENSNLFKSGGDKLADYLSAPNETTYFVFNEKDIDKRSRLYKAVLAKGYAAEFAAQDEKVLLKWIASLLKKEGKLITESNARLFLAKTGTDMNNISLELDKLICYCMDREVIGREDIETICTDRLSDRIFELVDAIAERRMDRALSLYYELLALRHQPSNILYFLGRQYNLLLQVKILRAKGNGNKAIGTSVGIPSYYVGKYADQASRFSDSDLQKAMLACVETEEAVKTGKLDDRMGLEVLILQQLRAAS